MLLKFHFEQNNQIVSLLISSTLLSKRKKTYFINIAFKRKIRLTSTHSSPEGTISSALGEALVYAHICISYPVFC
jgi:hypothetical protein